MDRSIVQGEASKLFIKDNEQNSKIYFDIRCKTCGSDDVSLEYIAEGFELHCNECGTNYSNQQNYCLVEVPTKLY